MPFRNWVLTRLLLGVHRSKFLERTWFERGNAVGDVHGVKPSEREKGWEDSKPKVGRPNSRVYGKDTSPLYLLLCGLKRFCFEGVFDSFTKGNPFMASIVLTVGRYRYEDILSYSFYTYVKAWRKAVGPKCLHLPRKGGFWAFEKDRTWWHREL